MSHMAATSFHGSHVGEEATAYRLTASNSVMNVPRMGVWFSCAAFVHYSGGMVIRWLLK